MTSGSENAGSADDSIQANCNLLDANSQGFEGGIGKWTPWYSTAIARSTAASEAGSASLLVNITAPYGWGIAMNDWPGLSASPGAMNVSFWARHNTGTSALSPSLVLHWRNASNADIRVDTVTLSNLTSAWQKATLTTSAPTGTTHLGLEVTGDTGSTGDTFYLDQVFVTESSCKAADAGSPPPHDSGAPPPLDGSTSDGSSGGSSGSSSGSSSGGSADAGSSSGTSSGGSSSGSTCTNPVFSTSEATGTDGLDSTGTWWVDNDAWNGSHGPQSIYVCSQSSWYAVSNQTDNQGQVETYPNTEYDIGGRDNGLPTKTIAQYNSITSTFSEAFPSAGSWDAAYDLWLNNWSIEIMIWNEWTGTQLYWPPSGAQALTLDGVPYHFYNNGGELMFFRDTMVKSGSVDILAAMKWLVSQGLVKSTDVPTQLEYGVEICSTNGSETFPLTGVTFNLN
jgi:hypothetical protein